MQAAILQLCRSLNYFLFEGVNEIDIYLHTHTHTQH